jgi:hypothetical protein
MRVTDQLLSRALVVLREIARRHGTGLRERLEAENQSDKRVVDELFEDEFDNLIRSDEQFHSVTDDLLDEIEKRFDLLDPARVRRTKQGWPLSWSLTTDDRTALIQAVSRFSSNHARYFGQLLTPLVNGVRVLGPFGPTWSHGAVPKLVLIDGEGLGHTPSTSASLRR